MPASPVILGIESSCDETAAAVVAGGDVVLSNVIATQHDLHARYAGVVPEIASRAHLERILPVVRDAVADAGVELTAIDAIAVGHRPGLIGSLLVGVNAAKTLAWCLGKPIVGVDHVQAHLHAGFLHNPDEPAVEAAFPAIGLVVSGGHTSLFHLDDPLAIELLGRTIDDAVGEAYDKTAALLGLDYPGGPALDRLAGNGDEDAYDFPVARLARGRLDFSFSGLKTAVLYAACGKPGGRAGGGRGRQTRFERDAATLPMREKANLAASFQHAAVKAIVRNLRRAIERCPDARGLLVGGGVSANRRLRIELRALAETHGLALRLPAPEHCVDNAAMIAGLAARRLEAGACDDLTLSAAPLATELLPVNRGPTDDGR